MALPTQIIVKAPNGSTQVKVLGSISDPVLAAELDMFRQPSSKLIVNGPIVKLIPG